MKKETIYYLVGGAAAIGLGVYAYKRNKGDVATLQASIITGGSVPVDNTGGPAKSIPTDVVQKMTTEEIKQVTKTNPEVLAQITPAQAVEIIDSTPAIKAIIPRVVQDVIKQTAATGSTAPVATVALPTNDGIARNIVNYAATTPIVSTPTSGGGSSRPPAGDRREYMDGLGSIERLVL